MAAKKPATTEVVDLKEFRRQKELVVQQAQAQISNKVDEVKSLLADIKELVELSGIQIRIDRLISDSLESIGELHPDWNSSSYEC